MSLVAAGLPCERLTVAGVTLAWIATDRLADDEGWQTEALLSPDERARAAAHRHARDRASYRAAHGLKRMVLGETLDRAPEALHFDHGPFGKPVLPGQDRLHFSLSHCDGLAVLAIADRPVGVDAERISAPFEAETAQIAFHPTEQALLAGLPESERSDAAYKLWLLREAHGKATGFGLAPPGQLAFALEPPRILHGLRQDEAWKFAFHRPEADHLIAVSTSGL